MKSVEIEHFIYGPAPKKGYSVRAFSPMSKPKEYKEICKGYYVPFEQNLFKSSLHESRVILSNLQRKEVFFSRIFKREKLDELKRSGILSHTAIIPREFLENGLSYKQVEKSMIDFENQFGIPIGEIQTLKISWDEQTKDANKINAPKIISEKSIEKIIESFRKNSDSKIFLISKNTTFSDRIEIAYTISKIVDIYLKVFPLIIMTEQPLPLIRDIFPNVIISDIMIPQLKLERGWVVVKPFPDDKKIYVGEDEETIKSKLKEIYEK